MSLGWYASEWYGERWRMRESERARYVFIYRERERESERMCLREPETKKEREIFSEFGLKAKT